MITFASSGIILHAGQQQVETVDQLIPEGQLHCAPGQSQKAQVKRGN
jgi:hypothetical protein